MTVFLIIKWYYFSGYLLRKDVKKLYGTTEKVEFILKEDVLIAKLSGDIDHHSATAAKKTIDKKLYERRPSSLTLDLSNVSFMDSSGLGLILGRFQLSSELGCNFSLNGVGENVMKILKLAGCDKLFETKQQRKENNNEKTR